MGFVSSSSPNNRAAVATTGKNKCLLFVYLLPLLLLLLHFSDCVIGFICERLWLPLPPQPLLSFSLISVSYVVVDRANGGGGGVMV
ncbi:unnamed protein product [Hymenolepis diminuta]|uniref:Secreted protein n=1 Tax=Hymenolepis diminuta TaxID=6216 RepID=A0A0R3SKN5_HYMDI|nr:unnamed protein product [Hymenolepis diminuta]